MIVCTKTKAQIVFQGVWHRVCLNTIVRKGVKLDSERLKILPMGSKVFVVEQKDRRVRIEQPIAGWCSLRSSNGDTILTPLDLEETDGYSVTTPVAGQLRNEQKNAQKKASQLGEKEKNLKEERDNLIQSNEGLQELTRELEKLKTEVRDQKHLQGEKEEALHELEVSQQKVKQLKELKRQQDEERRILNEKINNIQAQIEESGNQQLIELQNQIDRIEREKQMQEERVEEFDKIAQAAQEEVELLREEMENMFFQEEEPKQPKKQRLRPADVVLIEGGEGIVVIRYVGPVHFAEGEHIGVETSDPIGQCDGEVNGKRYFQTPSGCGTFYPVTKIKKIIPAEELLQKLHRAVKMSAREKTSKE